MDINVSELLISPTSQLDDRPPVIWNTVLENEHGTQLPWPTLVARPDSLTDAYGTLTSQRIYLDVICQSVTNIDPEALVWCGFPAKNVFDSASFGNRRHTCAITTEQMARPSMLTFNPAYYAQLHGFAALPGVAAIHRSALRRTFFREETAYAVKPHRKFDEAVAALLIAKY